MSPWRHVAAVLALPAVVTLVVPAAVLVLQSRLDWPAAVPLIPRLVLAALGGCFVLGGLALWAWTVSLFVRVGQGTLALWAPPTRLVTRGPYGLVRNPMITGVFAVLLGEAALFVSWGLLAWLAIFMTGNFFWIKYREEPDLERRFGPTYSAYKRHVPRWLPRLRPWRPPRGPAA